jgi:hypothetical protein
MIGGCSEEQPVSSPYDVADHVHLLSAVGLLAAPILSYEFAGYFDTVVIESSRRRIR